MIILTLYQEELSSHTNSMPPEFSSSPSANPTTRTIDDIYRERGENYPLERDILKKPEDRRDYLIVACALVTEYKKDAILRIRNLPWVEINKTLRWFKRNGKRLALWDIAKRILTFDYRQDITHPSVLEIRGLLDDMQRELDRKSTEVSVPSFLGMPIVDPRILAAMGSVKTRPIEPLPAKKIEALHQPEIPKKPPLSPVVHVPQSVARTLDHRPQPQRFFPRARPFLWPTKPREEPRRYFPPTPSSKPVQVPPKANTPPPKITTPPIPEFSQLSLAINWLREQKQWSALYREITKSSLNDISMRALLQTSAPYLLSVLTRVQSSFSCPTMKSIIDDALEPVPPVQSALVKVPELEPVSSPSRSPEVPVELKLSPEHETEVKRIFAFHKTGKYSEFWGAVQWLVGTETLSEIRQAQEVLKQKDLFRTIAFIAWHELTEKDVEPYKTHTWNQRIAGLPHVRAQWKRLLDHQECNSMKVIKTLLEDISITIPVLVEAEQTWMGFEESEAPERTLLAVVQSLIKLDGEDPTSTKKILRKVKQILWIPVEAKKA